MRLSRSSHFPVLIGVGSLLEQIESKQGAWTVETLAELLDCSPKLIYKLVSSRKLNAYRVGTLIRIDPKDAADYLRGHATLPQKPQPPKPR